MRTSADHRNLVASCAALHVCSIASATALDKCAGCSEHVSFLLQDLSGSSESCRTLCSIAWMQYWISHCSRWMRRLYSTCVLLSASCAALSQLCNPTLLSNLCVVCRQTLSARMRREISTFSGLCWRKCICPFAFVFVSNHLQKAPQT